MTETEFKQLLVTDRGQAIDWLMRAKVEEWMNDGPAEVARCLSYWAANGVNLGDNDTLCGLAESHFEEETCTTS